MSENETTTTDEGPSVGVDTLVGTPRGNASRGPHQRPRYAYFVDDWLIFRQELVFEEGARLGPGHQEYLIVETWAEWYEIAKEQGVDADDPSTLGAWVSEPGSIERYILPLVLRHPERYENLWEHVESEVCPGCQADRVSKLNEFVERVKPVILEGCSLAVLRGGEA